jgi:hypothetical protein
MEGNMPDLGKKRVRNIDEKHTSVVMIADV